MSRKKSRHYIRSHKLQNAYSHLEIRKRTSQSKQCIQIKTNPYDLTRIGAQDIAFKDDVLNQAYKYDTLAPYYQHELPKRSRTLRDWSARKLVMTLFPEQNDDLSQDDSNRWLSYLIDNCPVSNSWAVWRRVWHYILLSERDTPAVFNIFYSKFGSNSSFYCHHIPSLRAHLSTRGTNEDRTSYITMNCISRRHRFETLYANVHMPSLVNDLNRYNLTAPNNLVLLNLSNINLSKSYHYLTSLASLCFLNISGCSIESSALNSIFMAMKASKLQNLACIILNNNSGLMNHLDAKAQLPQQLQYIELSADRNQEIQFPSFVSIANAGFASLSDSLKLQYLLKRKLVRIPGLREQLLLDYKIIDQVYEPSMDMIDQCTVPWLKRMQVPRIRGVKSYTRRHERKIKIFKEVPSSSSTSSDCFKKRKVKKINFKKFFDM